MLASDGTHLGWLDHVRYERHVEHPDEIVVRSRRLLARRRRVLTTENRSLTTQRAITYGLPWATFDLA